MASTRVGICIAVLLVGLAGPSAAVAAPAPATATPAIAASARSATLAPAVRVAAPPNSELPPMLRDLISSVNVERESRGLAPMRYDERLGLAALRHSEDQARQGRATHTGSDGSTVAQRTDAVGYGWNSVAENVAAGYLDVQSVMAGWMASDGHRANVLSANVDIGVGLAYGPDGRPYWTQVVATPS